MSKFNFIDNGSVTSTPGFKACGVTAGLKKSGKADMALVFSEVPANFAGVFTHCIFAAAPVQRCRKLVRSSQKARAFIINSGNANACTGASGLANAEKMSVLTAAELQAAPEEVLDRCTIYENLPKEILTLYNDLWTKLGI
jgi:glutamate N-acetyltransferase/amino-acid N-acetyltransferase